MKVTARVAIEPGWHVGAPDPKVPAAFPLEITFSGPAGVTFDAVKFPPAVIEDLKALGGKQAVYSGRIEVHSVAHIPRTYGAGSDMTFSVTVTYQACSDKVCRPPVDAVGTRSLEVLEPAPEPGSPPPAAPSASPRGALPPKFPGRHAFPHEFGAVRETMPLSEKFRHPQNFLGRGA